MRFAAPSVAASLALALSLTLPLTTTFGPVRQALAQGVNDDPEQTACRQQFDAGLISVTILPIRPAVDVSLDTRALTVLESKPPGQRVLGRTTARLRNSMTVSTRVQKLPSGRSCARPSITVTLSYDPVIIFVGSEYKTGSCEFQKIVEHEQRHIAMHSLHLAELAPLVQADLREFYAGPPLVFDLPASAIQQFQSNTQTVIRSRIRQMSGEARARQFEVDSSEEIGKMSDLRKLCAQDPLPAPGER